MILFDDCRVQPQDVMICPSLSPRPFHSCGSHRYTQFIIVLGVRSASHGCDRGEYLIFFPLVVAGGAMRPRLPLAIERAHWR